MNAYWTKMFADLYAALDAAEQGDSDAWGTLESSLTSARDAIRHPRHHDQSLASARIPGDAFEAALSAVEERNHERLRANVDIARGQML
jgi:hypothetical protein